MNLLNWKQEDDEAMSVFMKSQQQDLQVQERKFIDLKKLFWMRLTEF